MEDMLKLGILICFIRSFFIFFWPVLLCRFPFLGSFHLFTLVETIPFLAALCFFFFTELLLNANPGIIVHSCFWINKWWIILMDTYFLPPMGGGRDTGWVHAAGLLWVASLGDNQHWGQMASACLSASVLLSPLSHPFVSWGHTCRI